MNFKHGPRVQMKTSFSNNTECFSIDLCIRSHPIYKDIWKSMLKKNYHVNVRMATVLICSGFAVNERYIMACVSVFSSLFTAIITHARQLKNVDPVNLGYCQ